MEDENNKAIGDSDLGKVDDSIEDELDAEISSSADKKLEGTDFAVAEDEETKIPVSYETAEESLLSMFIQDDDIAQMIAQSGLKDSHFLKRKNRLLYPKLLDIRLSKGTCNYDLVADACEKEVLVDGQTLLDYIGGMPELTKIMVSAPAEMDLKVAQAYIDIIFEQYKLSRVKETVRSILNQNKFDDNKMVEKLSSIQQILTENVSRSGLTGLDELVSNAYTRFMDRKANPEKYEGLKTGFYWIDRNRAIGRKRTCVIGARTSIGKSVFASNIITVMILNDLKVLLFTPELDKETYIDRFVCARAKVDIDKWVEAANITNDETTLIGKTQKELLEKASRNLFIEDRGSQTCSFILSSIKRHMLTHHVDVVVVDYLQKLHYYGDNTKKAITEIMERFCAFAKDNNIAFIVISQLRRPQAVRGSEDKDIEPKKEDLKESGDIENFADSVILLHRNSITRIADREKGWYKIDKNRTGPITDNVELRFNEHYLTFTEIDLPEEGVQAYDSWIPDKERDKLPNEANIAGDND